MSTENLKERLLTLIDQLTTPHRRFKQLEEVTGIDADRWKAFGAGRQRPTAEMIEAVGKAYPSLVLWLVTGEVEPGAGQYDPPTFAARKKYKIADLLKKEPCALTDEEMLVVESENKMTVYAERLEPRRFDAHDLWLVYEAREHGLTRNQLAKKLHDEQQAVMKEFARQRGHAEK